MNVIFRTDASTQIGTGHTMRCLTLADEIQDNGANVAFICREHTGNLCDYIEEKGYTVFRLPAQTSKQEAMSWNDHAHWLGAHWKDDARETIKSIKTTGKDIDWLIVDHYALDKTWEQEIRPLAAKIMVIDDLADRPHDCDVLLDQNLYEHMKERYKNLVPQHCRTFLGPGYALLRPEFLLARQQLRHRDGTIRRILVFFGGSDPTNETVKALEAIQQFNRSDITVDVIVGPANPYKEQIHRLCLAMENVYYHCNVKNMAEMIAAADLALGAGGATSWERCCLGLPGLTVSVAANQKELSHTLALNGGHLFLGSNDTVTVGSLLHALHTFLCLPEALIMISRKARQLVDGRGATRVARFLCPLAVSLRRATMDDCEAIYKWRNDKKVRSSFFCTKIIAFDEHQEWYEKSIESKNRILLIAEVEGLPVGVLIYDLKKTEAEISIYLVPGTKKTGIGTMLITSGNQWVRQHYPHIQQIVAEILPENITSQKAFKNAGFIKNHLVFVQKFIDDI